MFFSPVNSLACPQGQHINVYLTAHVIRHSLKNYKQWDYESLLGWNYIQFFPTDSPYGLFVWPFCSLRSLPSPTDHTWPLPETAAGVRSLRTPRLSQPGDNSGLQGSRTQAPRSPRLQHPQASARACQLPTRRDSSTGLPPCLGHLGLMWHQSTNLNS